MSKKFDNYLVGLFTVDKEKYLDEPEKIIVGGPILFSGYAGVGSGRRIGCLTKLAPEDMHYLFLLHLRDIRCLPSRHSCGLFAKYLSEDRELREQFVLGQADPITIADIPDDIESEVFQLASTINGQISLDVIPYLSDRGKVALDLQGFLRSVKDGMIEMTDWAEKEKYLPYVYYLKADAQEAEIATGTSDRRKAAKLLYEMGAKEIMITHNTEVLIYDGAQFYTCPLRARNLSGRTGRGDSTFGSYITERIYRSIPDSLLYASALVSLKMEQNVPFCFLREDVMDYVREFYPEYRFTY